MRIYEKKDSLIRKNPNLTDEQKQEIIELLSKYPSYESKVDWNKNTSLTYKDFYNSILKPLYIKGLNPKGLVKGKDYDIVPLDKEDEIIYVVYTYNASKILASNSVEPKIWTPLPDWCGREEFTDEAHAFGHFDSEHGDMKPGAKWCISMQTSDGFWKDYKKNYLFFFWFVDDPYFSDKWKKNAIGVDKENGKIAVAYNASDDSWHHSTDLPNQGTLGIPRYVEEAITDFFKDIKEKEKQKILRKLKSQLQFNKETNRYDYDGDLGSEFLVNFVSEDKKGFILNFGKVTGDFSCSYLSLTSLKGAPTEVGGYFHCSNNQLTSLKGAPQKVGGNFICSWNALTSLRGASQIVGGDFICGCNSLSSLEGAPQEIIGNFDCYYNQLTSLKGAPQRVEGIFSCNSNTLISLEGAPQKVGESFYCNSNQLISLEGAPQEVGESFSCCDNKLISLEGVPQEVKGFFACSNNKLTSLEGAPQKVGGDFDCSFNNLTSLEGSPVGVKGYFNCSNNKLTSFKGAPKYIGKDFYYVDNPNVKSLEGLEGVNGEIYKTWDF